MHEIGQKVVGVLREQFPDYDITGREQDYGCWLGVAFKVDGQHIVAYTPKEMDYRKVGYQIWVHRFAEIIRSKEPPS